MIHHYIELPLPPTVNHYYAQTKQGGKFIKPEGQVFRQEVALRVRMAKLPKLTGRICLIVRLYQRDRRNIDLDNRVKALQDALQHAGVFENDSQIDELTVKRGGVVPGGKCEVMIGIVE